MNLQEAIKLHDEDKLIGSFKIGNDDYHAAPGISSTFLIDATEYSLAHAKAWKEQPSEPSKAMAFGSLVHMSLLEPELIKEFYNIVPSTDKRTKEGKAIWEKARLEGKTPISNETYEKVQAIRKELFKSQTARSLFSDGVPEQAYFARDAETGLLIKAKADYINKKLKLNLDIKKTSDGRLWNIKKSVRDYGYKLQAAFYPDVINLAMKETVVDATIWVFIEETYPFGIRFVEVKDSWRQEGFNLYKEALHAYSEAMKTGFFPGYSDQIISIDEQESLS